MQSWSKSCSGQESWNWKRQDDSSSLHQSSENSLQTCLRTNVKEGAQKQIEARKQHCRGLGCSVFLEMKRLSILMHRCKNGPSIPARESCFLQSTFCRSRPHHRDKPCKQVHCAALPKWLHPCSGLPGTMQPAASCIPIHWKQFGCCCGCS